MSASRKPIDASLKDHLSTESQHAAIDAMIEHGTTRKAAEALGVHHSYIAKVVALAERRARTAGFVPREVTTQYDEEGNETGSSVKATPASFAEPGGVGAGPVRDGFDGYIIKGASTNFDAEGNQRQQWIKTKVDDVARVAALRDALDAAAEALPRERRISRKGAALNAKLLNLFTLTDCHIGMMAWHREGGENWDLRIAEDTLVAAFAEMIERAPRARTAIVNQLGDFLHFDGLDAVTPTNRHLLDADGRFHKITKVAIRVLRRVINMALETHERVHVICAEGNHDIASSAWLALLLAAIYEDNPRVTVDESPLPFYRYRFGKTLLGFHHGHCKKKESLPELFSQQFRADWGLTEHTYIHCGHRHHFEEKDKAGTRVIEHATLAARDAYAARHGYHAARQALAITYHEDFGEWGRATVTPEMLSAVSLK